MVPVLQSAELPNVHHRKQYEADPDSALADPPDQTRASSAVSGSGTRPGSTALTSSAA